MFHELGVHTIDGGPTLNPSTYDLLAGIHEVPAEEVVVLTNSANVIMAAEHAASWSDKQVLVAPTTSQQAGLAAAVALAPERSVEENARALTEALSRVRTGSVAPAARDDVQGRFKTGDAVGFVEDELIAWGEPRETLHAVAQALTEAGPGSVAPELLSVLAGDGAPIRSRTSRGSSRRTSSSSCATADSPRTGGCWPRSELAPARAGAYDRHRDHDGGQMAATSTNAPRTASTPGEGRITPLARAFASKSALSREELIAAPVRWPRPSRLSEPLTVSARRMSAGLRSLGLLTIGDLLEHLPTDSREARTVSTLRAGEPATVAVQVRRIAARPVRRRGMRPLVEASVFDSSGTMRATFFNQPWLVERYPPGTRLVLHGRPDARGGFAVSHHAPASERGEAPAAEGDSVAHYPASEGVSSTEILALVREAGAALQDVVETLPSATRVSESLPDRPSALAAMHFPRTPPMWRAVAGGWHSRSCCSPSCCSCAGGPGALSGPARTSWTARVRSPSAGAARSCRSRPPAISWRRWRRSAPTWPGPARCTGC